MGKSRLFNDTPYLPFAAHDTQIDASLDMPKTDIELLRTLGKRYAQIASLPIQKQRKNAWADINDLKGGKPLIWVNEICWHEMNVEDELTLHCTSPAALRLEAELRKTIYQWEHMQGDMVVEPVIFSPYILENTGFGIAPEADVAETSEENTIASRRFHCQISNLSDIEKIKIPIIQHRSERTEAFFQTYQHIFQGILPVIKYGCSGFWFAPWDELVFWMGAEELLMNLAVEPELMHTAIDRLVEAYLAALDQLSKLGLVASNNLNVRIGSGGYGYTNELAPMADNQPLQNLWGSSTPQIFGSVSSHMHDEFGIQYETKWLKRFGLNYYGCCEPLHNKIDILAQIPNLRKISISPWAKVDVAAEAMEGKYVMSLKPSPTPLAQDTFDEALVRQELKEKLKAAKNCSVEVILKDLSTVRHQPQRLWRWVELATAITREFE